jgi:transcription antitermination factor NusG
MTNMELTDLSAVACLPLHREARADISRAYWYAVHVKSRHEFKVVERLKKSGIETFLPAVERLSRWKDRKKLINFPLFPGYIFVHMSKIYEAMLTVLKTQGVVRFLGIVPGEPEVVSEDQIVSLKKLVESKESLDPYPYLKEGQRVRIKRGPLAGVEGVLAEREGQHLLVLSVDILRQGVSLKIDALDVERV